MSFGQSHRQLVEDTNKGAVEPTSSERATSQAQVSGKQTTFQSGEHDALAALVNVADIAAKPAIAEANRKKELQGYEDAGTEEGKEAADSASDVWHNKLFGSDASLRGAQERIAEDNSRRIYLEAQKELEHGDAASWDDDKWKEWKDKQLEDEIGKYESEGMKDHITSAMGRDFQNLERDRTWKREEHLQAENRKSTQQSFDTIVETFNSNSGSTNPQRSEEDSKKQIQEILALKEKSGVSDAVFASIAAQAASNDLINNNDEFTKLLQDAGIFDVLDFEDQQRIEDALEIHEIKNSEEFGDRYQAIYGPSGMAARGDVNGALAAFDSLVKDYPKAVPDGGRNALRNHVREVARSNAETARHQQEIQQHAKDDALNDTSTPYIRTDHLGRSTVVMPSAHDKLVGAQAAVEEIVTNDFHADQRASPGADGAAYERRDMTAAERDQYTQKHAAQIGQIQASTGVLLPQTQQMLNRSIRSLDHAVLTNMSDDESERLTNDLTTLTQMAKGSAGLEGLMVESLSPEGYGRLKSAQRALSDERTTAQAYGKQLQNEAVNADLRGQTALGTEQGGTTGKGVGGNNNDYAYTMKGSQVRSARSNLQDMAKEGGWLIFNKGQNNEVIDRDLRMHYNDYLSNNANPGLPSVIEDAENYAAGKVLEQGAYIKTTDGKNFLQGLRQAETTVQESGFKDLNAFVEDYSKNPHNIDQINQGGNLGIGPSLRGGNPVANNVSEVIDNGDGSISLVFPREGEQPYRHVVTLPDPNDPTQRPIKFQEDAARSEYGMSIVNDDEKWKEDTNSRESPREKYDRSIKREIIKENLESLSAQAEAAGVEKRSKRGTRGIYHYSDLEPFVTDDMVYERVPVEEYNNQVSMRQTDAVEKQVRKMRKLDDFIKAEQEQSNNYGHSPRRSEATEIKELENTTVDRYVPGENFAEQQKRHDAQMAIHRKKAEQFRSDQIAEIKSNLK